MDSLLHDLRYAFRSLCRAPGFAIIAIITLGLGIAVNTTVFSVINGILLRPLPVPHPEQITVLGLQQNGDSTFQSFSYPDYQDITRDTSGVFSDVFGYNVTLSALNADNRGDHCIFSRVTGNYFSALGVKPAVGRLSCPRKARRPAPIPSSFSVITSGRNASAAIPPSSANTFWSTVTQLPSLASPRKVSTASTPSWTWTAITRSARRSAIATMRSKTFATCTPSAKIADISLLGRLKPGVSLQQARASLNVVAQRLAQDFPSVDKDIAIRVFPEKLARPEPDPDNTLPRAAIAFSALAALVLLVACFNIANVLLVRATAREREMGVRAALGAGRGRLIRQHLTESLLLSFLGAIAGVILATWCAGFLSTLSLGTDLPIRFDLYPDLHVYLFALGAVIVTAVVVGLVPALRVARADVNSLLREGGRSASDGRKRHIVRNILVGAQLAGSMLLLIVAGLFTRSLSKAEQINMGFNPDHVLDLSVDVNQLNYSETQGRAFFTQLDDRIATIPGVVSVAQAFTLPLGVVSADAAVTLPGHELPAGQQPPKIMRNLVTPKYFDTLQIPFVSGRTFTDSDDEKAPRVAVINESMAKQFWPNQSALGQHFNDGEQNHSDVEVIGVVRDSLYKEVSDEHKTPFFYMSLAQEYLPMRTIQLRTSVPPESLATQVEAQVRELAPGLPVSQVQSMKQSLQGVTDSSFSGSALNSPERWVCLDWFLPWWECSAWSRTPPRSALTKSEFAWRWAPSRATF